MAIKSKKLMRITLFFYIGLVLTILAVFNSCDYQQYPQGKNLYAYFCENCHMEDGKGLKQLIPPLAGADWVRDNQNMLACVMKHGMEGEIVVNGQKYNQPMAAIEDLGPVQIANIINYINSAWGNDYGFYSVEQVKKDLKKCDKK